MTVDITVPDGTYFFPSIPDAYLFPKPQELLIKRDDSECNDFPTNAISEEEFTIQVATEEITCNKDFEVYEHSFGPIINRNIDEAYLDIKWGELKPYIGWNEITNTFTMTTNSVNQLAAKPYRIKITIREEFDILTEREEFEMFEKFEDLELIETTYTVTLRIEDPTPVIIEPNETDTGEDDDGLDPFPTDSNDDDEPPEWTPIDSSDFVWTPEIIDFHVIPTASGVSSGGVLVFDFSEPVDVPEDEYKFDEMTVAWRQLREIVLLTDSGYKTFQVKDAIEVSIVSKLDSKRRAYHVEDWSIVKFTPDRLEIQLVIDEPEKYTVTRDQSYVRVNFYTANLLTSQEGNKQIPFRLQVKVPFERQVDPVNAEVAQKFGYGFKLLLTFILLPLFAVLIWMSISLLPFWTMVNSLQILLHLPLLNIQLPGQVSIISAHLLEVVRFSYWNPLQAFWDKEIDQQNPILF